jgi:2,3-bisphosphoglycerate-dependent phosphoglycerate mutase
MNIYLIRHAQSINNYLWELHGSDDMRQEDPELSDLGLLQAKLLAEFLSRVNPDLSGQYDRQNAGGFYLTHLYVSPMIRSVATGVEIGRQIGLQPEINLELFEGGGIYLTNPDTGEREGLAGKDRDYYQLHFPEVILPPSISEGGWWNRPFEPREERRPRAMRVKDELMRRHGGSDDNVALVTHAGFYNHFMAIMLDIPAETKIWFRLDNAAITRLLIDDYEIRLVYANRLDFLPREWIT